MARVQERPLVLDSHVRHVQLSRVVASTVVIPLVYCILVLYFFSGTAPWPGPWLVGVALVSAALGAALPDPAARRVFDVIETVVRYALALLLLQYALNKLIPGQFLLYNRDFDLPVRELPARRLAWHFLGYSRLYNAFAASVELTAAVLLLSRRTSAAGALLGLAALVNVVAVDIAFGIRGALPIATVMACAALALTIVHVEIGTLRLLVWRRHSDGFPRPSMADRLIPVAAVVVVVGFPLYVNLGTRRGLTGQVPAAGRWEVLDCRPSPEIALCRSPTTGPAVLYIEVGQWGQLLTGAARRDVTFSYDQARRFLEVRIPGSDSGREPGLVLSGTVDGGDATAVLEGSAAGLPPFVVHLRRTRPAPWPPVRAY